MAAFDLSGDGDVKNPPQPYSLFVLPVRSEAPLESSGLEYEPFPL